MKNKLTEKNLIEIEMKKRNILLILFAIAGFIGNAQVKDISVTLSPAAEYTWWDNHAGLNNGMLVGGKLGFGFGEYMELRGIYLQSYDLTTNFENFGLTGYIPELFSPQAVTLTRWGGELKANIGTGKLKPYITLGTGIQSFEIPEMNKLEQIYASAGIGLKINLFPRAVLLVEAKNTTYNFNAGADLLTSADKSNFGVTEADFNRERLSNWAVQGALQFYLGGRRPGVMTDLDKAYLNKFNSGLQGIQPIIEPGVGYIAFNENSLYRDTWLAGGYAGIDFGEYVGIRGFYFQATKSSDINTDFDNLSMYGLELRARLNDGNGVTPYLALGGGYLDPTSGYLGKDGVTVKGGEFASGGLGLNIPLGKRVLISGGARAMLTSGGSALGITNPNEIQTHVMYNAGIKFTLGKKSRSTDDVYNETLNRDVESKMAENNLKIQQMKSDYQTREKALQQELQLAYEAKNVDKAVELMEEKNEVQASLKEIGKLEGVQGDKQKVYSTTTDASAQNVVKMSPAEFESLIIRILEATGSTRDTNSRSVPVKVGEQSQEPANQQQQIDLLNNKIEDLEKLLKDINEKDELDKASATSARILEELEALNMKLELNSVKNGEEGDKPQTILVTPPAGNSGGNKDGNITTIDENGKVISSEPITETDQRFIYKNSSFIFGINLGGSTTTNLGARLHYDIKNTSFEFMPELFIGLGNNTSYGISGNVIYPVKLKNGKVVPYAGIGLGIARINKEVRGNYNIILGARLPFILKNLSVDYTMRNTFEYNQLALGYSFPF